MKFRKCLSSLLAVILVASCFAGMTAFAASSEIISDGTIIYANDFESETAEDGKVPVNSLQLFNNTTREYSVPSPSDPIITKVTSDGNKYMLIGQSETGGNLTTGDTRFGAAFSPISSGIITVDFDAIIYNASDDNRAAIGFAASGSASNYWFFSAHKSGAIGVNPGGSPSYSSAALFTANVWNHYTVVVDLDNKTSTLKVNDGASNTVTLDCKSAELMGFVTYTPNSTDFAVDNIKITTGSQIKRTVYADYSFENGTDSLALVGASGDGTNQENAAITDTASATLGANNSIYAGAYSLGNKVYSVGRNKYHRCNEIFSDGANGVYKVEFDALVGNGGLGIGLGSTATGGGIKGRYPFAFQRATGNFVAETVGTSTKSWYDSTTNNTETVYTAEGTETNITYVKNKWTHVILEINAKTGYVTAIVDGVKSNPVYVSYIVSAPITSIGFTYGLSTAAYNGATDHNAYIDNLRIAHEDNLDIKAVASAKGKIIVEFEKDIAAVSTSDVTVTGGTVTSVNVSGNKLLAGVTGLVADKEYDIVFSDNVKFADDTRLALKSYRFSYNDTEFSATPVVFTLDGKTARTVVNAQPSLEAETIYSYIAAYDADGNLVEAAEKIIPILNTDYIMKSVSVTHTFDDASAIATVKAFAWDADMVPFDNASEFIVRK